MPPQTLQAPISSRQAELRLSGIHWVHILLHKDPSQLMEHVEMILPTLLHNLRSPVRHHHQELAPPDMVRSVTRQNVSIHPRLITCGLMKTSTSIMTTAFLRLCLCAGRWTVQQLDVLAAVCLADSRRMRRRILTGLVSVAAPAGLYI